MAIAIALHGFNDLGRSVTPLFLSRNIFLVTIFYTLSKNQQKFSVGSKKKKIFVHGTSNPVILRLQGARNYELFL